MVASVGRASLPFILALAAMAALETRAGAAREEPHGPPANIHAGAFRSTIEAMWRGSPYFRWQCIQLGTASQLRVKIRAEAGPWQAARARTEISRVRGVVTVADVVLSPGRDHVELIAHELEHVIEQLQGIRLRSHGCNGGTPAHDVYESCRAVEAGRRVAREVSEERAAHGRSSRISRK